VASVRPPLVAVRARLREALDALAFVVFPAPCRICATTLDTASRIPICTSCIAALKPLTGPQCQKCGRPIVSLQVSGGAQVLCHACRREVYDFDFARSYGAYDDAMVRAVLLLKYEGVLPLGGWFAARLAETVRAHGEEFAADVVVPVPLHPARLRERGHNQAELIARPLARRLGLPLRGYLLVRTKPRPDKLHLTRRERWETVRGAYEVYERARVDKLRVLLVDDVMTTGATLDACSRALRQAGASHVAALTVARVMSNWAKPGLDW
jgi:competence protein ComFC